MKILGISGSPRPGGNTETLLDRVLEGAESEGAVTEKVILNEMDFCPCQECEDMPDDGSCLIEDDMQKIYRKIKESDTLVLASPIFFGSLSAQTKAMIDRFQCAWRVGTVFGKDNGYKKIKGVFLSVEGSDRKDFFENAKSIVKNFFAIIKAKYEEELFCPGLDDKKDAIKDEKCMNKAYEVGKKIGRSHE